MRSLTAAAALAVIAALGGCAHDVRTRLPNAPSESTGSIAIILTQPARDLTVAVDGVLAVERAHTKKVRIEGVPIGYHTVTIAAGSGPGRIERQVDVSVEEGGEIAIPLGSPENAMNANVWLGALTAVSCLAIRVFYDVFR